jgi:hypothetical protein
MTISRRDLGKDLHTLAGRAPRTQVGMVEGRVLGKVEDKALDMVLDRVPGMELEPIFSW